MQHFQRAGIVERLRFIRTAKITGGQGQDGAHTFAAAQQAVPCRRADLFPGGQVSVAQLRQAFFRFMEPGAKTLPICFLRHTLSPVCFSSSVSISSILSFASSRACLQ